MDERVVTNRELKEDTFEQTIRPDSLDEYIGQSEIKENLSVFIKAAKLREEQLKREVIDVTLPAKKNNVGHRHPNTIALEEVERIFIGLGYEVVEGPEVDYD